MTQPPTLDYGEPPIQPLPLLAKTAFAFGCLACAYGIYGWINISNYSMSVPYTSGTIATTGIAFGIAGRLITGRSIAVAGLILSIAGGAITALEHIAILTMIAGMSHC